MVLACDFVVMEIEEDPYKPLILGSVALKTLNALINCKDDTIIMEVAKKKLVFQFSKTTKMPLMKQACRMEVIDSEVNSSAKRVDSKKALEQVLYEDGESLSKEAMSFKKELDGVQPFEEEEVVLESIFEVEEVDSLMEECTMPPPKVSLKPLPPGLKYAYLDVEQKCLAIVNDTLDDPSLEN